MDRCPHHGCEYVRTSGTLILCPQSATSTFSQVAIHYRLGTLWELSRWRRHSLRRSYSLVSALSFVGYLALLDSFQLIEKSTPGTNLTSWSKLHRNKCAVLMLNWDLFSHFIDISTCNENVDFGNNIVDSNLARLFCTLAMPRNRRATLPRMSLQALNWYFLYQRQHSMRRYLTAHCNGFDIQCWFSCRQIFDRYPQTLLCGRMVGVERHTHWYSAILSRKFWD